MARFTGSFALALLVPGVVVASVAGGCASGELDELVPAIDPNLPSVDAGSSPEPVPGTRLPTSSGEEPTDEGDGEEDPVGTDAGSSSDAGDAGSSSDAGDAGSLPPIKPGQGDILITEIMYDPLLGSEPSGEWIEVYNRASSPRTLAGLSLKDGANRTHVIASAVVLAPGAYGVLARSRAGAIATKVPASVIVYEYGAGLADNAGVLLANGSSGGVALFDGSTSLSNVQYGGWFSQGGGSSIQIVNLNPAHVGMKANWCMAQTIWASGADKGTPGVANDCP